ncbi:dihydrolipoyl dehydrogenase family protein [Cumulibacter soli]|uniref:dihydrolipoyl dehydrogenase family protein n=1 Tax=Cumulibacter soli TaxID=2546344 RepID=UPI0010677199|nr:FAD-dependent oxidoreductase [Cumulibacter soli]
MTASNAHPTATPVDLVVIGLGPGGETLASRAASAGLSVVAVDEHLVGGECPYYGCIPTKMMLRAAETLAESRRASQLSASGELAADWSRLATRVAEEATDRWSDKVAVERLEQAGARVIHGRGRVTAADEVEIERPDGQRERYRADRGIVLNPGTRPAAPPIDGLAQTPYWTNRDAVQAVESPHSLIIIGGGASAVEFAQAFARFSTRVTVVEAGERLISHDEPEASDVLQSALEADGIVVVTGGQVVRVDNNDGSFWLSLRDADVPLHAERLLVAAGRIPNLDGIGLSTLGMTSDSIDVGDDLRIAERIWLIGDAAGRGAFTHTSMHHSDIVARQLLDLDGPRSATPTVPHVTFTDPEVASVGLTEKSARDAGIAVAMGKANLGSRGFTHGPGAENGFVKVVADTDRQILVGATAVGPFAGEVLGMLTLAVHAQLPIATLESMIYAYPTFHRAISSALSELSSTGS